MTDITKLQNNRLNANILFLLSLSFITATGSVGLGYFFIALRKFDIADFVIHWMPIILAFSFTKLLYNIPTIKNLIERFEIKQKRKLVLALICAVGISIFLNTKMLAAFEDTNVINALFEEYQDRLANKDHIWLSDNPILSTISKIDKGRHADAIDKRAHELSSEIAKFLESPDIKLKLIAKDEQRALENYNKALEAQKHDKPEEAESYLTKIPNNSKHFQDAQKLLAKIQPILAQRQNKLSLQNGKEFIKKAQYIKAMQALQAIPRNAPEYSQAKQLIVDNTQNLLQEHYQKGVQHASNEEWEQAHASMLEVLKKDKKFKDAQKRANEYSKYIQEQEKALQEAKINAASKWEISTDSSPIDDTKTVILSLRANNALNGWLATHTPVLTIRCHERKTDVILEMGMPAYVEYGYYNQHTVEMRLDRGKAFKQKWSESTDNDSLFAPSPIPLAKKIANSKTMMIRVTPHNSSPQTIDFDTFGLEYKLGEVSKACGWK